MDDKKLDEEVEELSNKTKEIVKELSGKFATNSLLTHGEKDLIKILSEKFAKLELLIEKTSVQAKLSVCHACSKNIEKGQTFIGSDFESLMHWDCFKKISNQLKQNIEKTNNGQ